MNLREEFEKSWRAGRDHDSLLALVHQHERQGLTPCEAYDILEKLWLDNGYNDCDQFTPLRNNLESVLERVWYERPATR